MIRFIPMLLLCGIARADVLEINTDTRARLGIVTADLEEMQIPPSISGFATVLDPAPLVTLLRQAAAAAKTVEFSQESLDRAEKLFSSGNLVPQKTVQAAKAQLIADQAAHRNFLESIVATYGLAGSLVTAPGDLLLSKQVLLRFSTPVTLESEPTAVSLSTSPPVTYDVLSRAPTADPIFQKISWLVLAQGGDLVPGMTLPATLILPGDPEKGHLLPASAVVWHFGIPWIFHESTPGKFERISVPQQKNIDRGWFLTESKFPMKSVVITGAQLLLSSEISEPE